MTPSGRQETLDDSLGWWNWCRILALGMSNAISLMDWTYMSVEHMYGTKIVEAVRQRRFTSRIMHEYNKNLPATTISEWQGRIDAWNNDTSFPHTVADPYRFPRQGMKWISANTISYI
jgi:hypothetical protein